MKNQQHNLQAPNRQNPIQVPLVQYQTMQPYPHMMQQQMPTNLYANQNLYMQQRISQNQQMVYTGQPGYNQQVQIGQHQKMSSIVPRQPQVNPLHNTSTNVPKPVKQVTELKPLKGLSQKAKEILAGYKPAFKSPLKGHKNYLQNNNLQRRVQKNVKEVEKNQQQPKQMDTIKHAILANSYKPYVPYKSQYKFKPFIPLKISMGVGQRLEQNQNVVSYSQGPQQVQQEVRARRNPGAQLNKSSSPTKALEGFVPGDEEWEFLKSTQNFIQQRSQGMKFSSLLNNFDEVVQRHKGQKQELGYKTESEEVIFRPEHTPFQLEQEVQARHSTQEQLLEQPKQGGINEMQQGQQTLVVKDEESSQHFPSSGNENLEPEELEYNPNQKHEGQEAESNHLEQEYMQQQYEMNNQMMQQGVQKLNLEHAGEEEMPNEEDKEDHYAQQIQNDFDEDEYNDQNIQPGEIDEDNENEGSGFVNEYYDNGAWYEGYTKNGQRHGKGKFYYKAGGVYDGQWENGKINGLGTLYYASGDIAYHGQWKDEMFNGRGVIYNDNPQLNEDFDYTDFSNLQEMWVKYQGDFKHDAKDGVGTLYLVNGDKFFGTFSDDQVSGKGKYTIAANPEGDEEEITGEWENNMMVQKW